MYQRLDRTRYDDTHLFRLVSDQILHGDSTNLSMLGELCYSHHFKQAMANDITLKQAVNVVIEQYRQEVNEHNNPHALMLLGFMSHQGIGCSIDYPQAIRYFEQAITLGNADAMNSLALMHQHGQGCPVNLAKAIELYDKSAGLGNTNAMYNRAFMYQHGQGGPVDFDKAIELYDKAIELGDKNAMNNRASMHHRGQGAPINFAKAIELLDRAIELGSVNAMGNRAFMHFIGQGGRIDLAKAIELYDKAIELGDANAMINRALIHQHAQGGPINLARAIWFYERAIRRGIMKAKENLDTVTIDSEIAQALLELMWDELVEGQSITEKTLSALSQYSKAIVLEKIKNSDLGTSFAFLKQLKANPTHPLTMIMNEGKTDTPSDEFKALIHQVRPLAEIRAMFFNQSNQENCAFAQLPTEHKDAILTMAQPGFARDKEKYYDEPTFNTLSKAH